MKSVAVLLDAGFVERQLYRLLGSRHATAEDIWQFAQACARPDEEIFRIYYYDCAPLEKKCQHPLSGRSIDFSKTDTAKRKTVLHRDLALRDRVAFRAGVIGFDGWQLTRTATNEAIKALKRGEKYELKAEDVEADIKQKRVDMKIGLDIAWLSSKRIVERLLLVTADTDFVPALKFARREGIQVVLVPMGSERLHDELRIHADEVRDVVFPMSASA